MSFDPRDHEHDHVEHGHAEHGHSEHVNGHHHPHEGGSRADGKGGKGSTDFKDWIGHLVRPHSHDHADSLDDALMVSKAGTRALAISFTGLLVSAVLQLVVFIVSGSVGLLADTIHNFADAFTALPIGLAFVVARRRPTKRYTYGFGRAEDLAGLAVIFVIAASAVIAAWEAIDRFVHPHHVTNLGWVAAAGVIGFLGNELAARYRMRVGNKIGSAALVADGLHARTDGLTSLAVVVGAVGVAVGWRVADPIVGLAITVAILGVLRGAGRDIYRRLMDAVDPSLVDQIEQEASGVPGVEDVDGIHVRWVGHELRAELNITVDRDLHVFEAHNVAEAVRHVLLHNIRRLSNATIHTDPHRLPGSDPHELTSHHYGHRIDAPQPDSRKPVAIMGTPRSNRL
jgi:cation diffusion facilitator family transporter